MFTGIIEALGRVTHVRRDGGNLHIQIASPVSRELKVDQSLSHDGVCLTVTECDETHHRVTAIEETIRLTTLGDWQPGRMVNLERAMQAGSRLDGHFVQGHVDAIATCTRIIEADGSRYFEFQYPESFRHLIVAKGSITVNGVSLTVVDPHDDFFQVAIIPYTMEHTNFGTMRVGDRVNLEFDIIGKYFVRYMEAYRRAGT